MGVRKGLGNGQFSYPFGIDVDGSSNVYVADTYNNRIQVFTSGGSYVKQWGSGGIRERAVPGYCWYSGEQ